MFELSSNVNISFYYIYFATLIMALFSTLMICSYNMQNLLFKKKSVISAIVVVLIDLILSTFGYSFIVKYLYVLSGIISGVYVIMLVIMITIKLSNLKNNIKKNNN